MAKPFSLCAECGKRLLARTLRPIEFFNLVAIHGHVGHLHDDFYDYSDGRALNELAIDSDRFPIPRLEDIRDDLQGYWILQSFNMFLRPTS